MLHNQILSSVCQGTATHMAREGGLKSVAAAKSSQPQQQNLLQRWRQLWQLVLFTCRGPDT